MRKYSPMPTIGSNQITAIHISLRMTPELPISTLTIAKISNPSITAPTKLIAVGIISAFPSDNDQTQKLEPVRQFDRHLSGHVPTPPNDGLEIGIDLEAWFYVEGPASVPKSKSTAKAQSDRNPRLGVVPTRAIIIATLVDRPIIAAVSSRIAIRTWVVAVWTGLVVTIGRLAVRHSGDRRFVIEPLVVVAIDPAVV